MSLFLKYKYVESVECIFQDLAEQEGIKMLHIITDSASDLPKKFIEEHRLHVIPTPVVIDGVDYFDGKTIQTDEFYGILDDITRDVKTYHINPTMFEEAFRPYAQAGDSVIYMCFSTGIAGTYNAANIARNAILEEYPDFDLNIVDSKSASVGFGLVVSKLVAMKERGASKEELLEAAEYYISHIKHVFTVQTLAYLVKGGRLTKFKGTIAETLQMKPVLVVDGEGALAVIKTVRGRKKSLNFLVDYAKSTGKNLESQTVAVCHGEDPEALAFMKSAVETQLEPKDILISVVGCAIGAHTGRGIAGLCFFDADDGKYAAYFR